MTFLCPKCKSNNSCLYPDKFVCFECKFETTSLEYNKILEKGGHKPKMATIKDAAQAYEPPQTLNIADLDKVSVEVPIEDREGKKKDNTTFKYKVAIVNGEEYRVPATVLKDLKIILETKPDCKLFKVVKEGEGMSTDYTVISL